MAQHGLMGRMEAPIEISYIADSVILLSYFEAGGAVHQALSVLKKRDGAHERTIRELRFSNQESVWRAALGIHRRTHRSPTVPRSARSAA